MSAKPRISAEVPLHARRELLPAVDYSAQLENAAEPELKVVSSKPAPVADPHAKPSDPLAAFMALSEEEKIALFS